MECLITISVLIMIQGSWGRIKVSYVRCGSAGLTQQRREPWIKFQYLSAIFQWNHYKAEKRYENPVNISVKPWASAN